ncbi:hypothetical protein HDV00_011364, partial [Rhizophlyctis rosea]
IVAAGPGPFAGNQWAGSTPPTSPPVIKDAAKRRSIPAPAGPPPGAAQSGWSTPVGLQPPANAGSRPLPTPIATSQEGLLFASGCGGGVGGISTTPSPVPTTPAPVTPTGDGILLASGRAARAAAQAAAAAAAAQPQTSGSPENGEGAPAGPQDGGILIASGRRRSRTMSQSASRPESALASPIQQTTPTTNLSAPPAAPQPWGANPQVWNYPAQLTSASSTRSNTNTSQASGPAAFVYPWAKPPNQTFAPPSNDPWAAPPQNQNQIQNQNPNQNQNQGYAPSQSYNNQNNNGYKQNQNNYSQPHGGYGSNQNSFSQNQNGYSQNQNGFGNVPPAQNSYFPPQQQQQLPQQQQQLYQQPQPQQQSYPQQPQQQQAPAQWGAPPHQLANSSYNQPPPAQNPAATLRMVASAGWGPAPSQWTVPNSPSSPYPPNQGFPVPPSVTQQQSQGGVYFERSKQRMSMSGGSFGPGQNGNNVVGGNVNVNGDPNARPQQQRWSSGQPMGTNSGNGHQRYPSNGGTPSQQFAYGQSQNQAQAPRHDAPQQQQQQVGVDENGETGGFVFSNPRRGKMLLKLKIETKTGGHQTLAVHEVSSVILCVHIFLISNWFQSLCPAR